MLPQINRDASKEEQIAQAAEFAGVSPKTLDGLWRTETNRGTHPTMVGPATKWGTAKGHFQQLDSIQKELSKRAGRDLDPFDFTDAVTMASMQLKENMDRYGNERDAVLAYHGGTNKANWGEKTQEYANKVLGADFPTVGKENQMAEVRVVGKRGKENLTESETWLGADTAGRVADQHTTVEADFGGMHKLATTNVYQDYANQRSAGDFAKQAVINNHPF